MDLTVRVVERRERFNGQRTLTLERLNRDVDDDGPFLSATNETFWIEVPTKFPEVEFEELAPGRVIEFAGTLLDPDTEVV